MTGQTTVATDGLVTALPASGQDGQRIHFLVDQTNGVVWDCVYLGSTGKWHVIGGPPIISEVATDESTSSVNTYAALTTAGPAVTLPAAGDYFIVIGAETYASTANANGVMSYDIGATGASDNDAAQVACPSVNKINCIFRQHVKTGLTAVTLTAKYYTDTVSTAQHFRRRFMTVLGIRLG